MQREANILISSKLQCLYMNLKDITFLQSVIQRFYWNIDLITYVSNKAIYIEIKWVAY